MKHTVHSDEWLFSTPTYPDAPGVKSGDDTALSAAAMATPNNAKLKVLCLEEIRKRPGAAFEIAARLNRTAYSVAPVCSQLRKLGLIQDSGRRFINPLGGKAIVWEAVPNAAPPIPGQAASL